MLKHLCPCCGRHCYLNNTQCERGAVYAQTGVIPPRAPKAAGHNEKKNSHKKKYHTLDQDNKLIWNLRDMGHVIRSLSEGKGSQSRILYILSEEETMTQRELTERLGIQSGSASEVIGKLENAGFIERTPSEEDRRTSDIRLTDTGRLKAMEAVEQRKLRHAEMFSCLSEEDKADFLVLLEKVNNDWRYRYGGKESTQKHKNDADYHTRHSGKE